MYKKFAVIMVGCYASLHAFQVNFASTNTYEGQIITPELLYEKLEAPTALARTTKDWLNNHPTLAHHFSGEDAPLAGNPDERLAYHKQVHADIQKAGYNTLSPSVNWVLKMTPYWLLKVSGEMNRHENLTTYFGKDYKAQITSQELDCFKAECGVTYQTISRGAYYLRAKEVIRKEGLDIRAQDAHLVHMPGRRSEVCDASCVILEKIVEGRLTYLEDHERAIYHKTMRDMTILVGYTAAWNHKKNIVIDQQDSVHYLDFEQPNRHDPRHFFHKDAAVHRSNVHHGWAELENQIIKPYAEKHNVDVTELLEDKHRLQEQIVATWE